MPVVRLTILIALVAAAFASAVVLLPHSPAELRTLILSAGVAAPAIAIATWIVLTPAMFSGTVLAAASGLAFGAVRGAGLSLIGAVLGALVAFALARTLGRSHVETILMRRPRLKKVHNLLERRGFLAVLAARLMPGVPATGLHYAAGASPVSARAFGAAMAIGALLRTAPYAVLGQGIGAGSLATVLVAGASIVVGALTAGILARRLRAAAPRK